MNVLLICSPLILLLVLLFILFKYSHNWIEYSYNDDSRLYRYCNRHVSEMQIYNETYNTWVNVIEITEPKGKIIYDDFN